MMIFFYFIFGLIVGSFLNVVVYRFRSGEGGILGGRSHCRGCSNPLLWYDNIPLYSFLVLRARCRHCRVAISWQYPLVELFGGLAFVLAGLGAAMLHGHSLPAMLYGASLAMVFAAMIVVFVYDLKYMEVPMVAIWVGVFFAAVGVVISDLLLSQEVTLWQSHVFLHGIAGLLAFLFFFTLSYVSQERWMGYGDGFIALIVGLVLGPQAAFLGVILGVWAGAIIGVALTFRGGKTMQSAIPFGPFLVGGMFAAFVVQAFFPRLLSILW